VLLLGWFNQSSAANSQKKNQINESTQKTMKVHQILEGFSNPPLELVSETLDQDVPGLKLETLNWEEFPYLPDVEVQIAYNDNELFLQYKVNEQSVKAEQGANNGKVWTDSCVEFFLSPDRNDVYYNLEMNCIGTALLGFRKKGDPTEHAPDEVINSIRRISTLGNATFHEKKEQTAWKIIVAIPWKVFFKHNLVPVKGKKMRGNFYKCGDELSVPHFVSWTKIDTEKPAFHMPEFFGGLEFE
jgi:hypothetical protein